MDVHGRINEEKNAADQVFRELSELSGGGSSNGGYALRRCRYLLSLINAIVSMSML